MKKKNKAMQAGVFICYLLFCIPFISQEQNLNFRSSDDLSTNLPIVIINTNGQEIPDEPKITAEMGIIYNGPGQMNNQNDTFNNYDGFVGIEVRGQSSQYFYPKKSYSFETRDADGENLDVSLLGMPEENDWVLYAPYGDKSMLRNVVTFSMARSQGNYVTRTMYCEVILNDEYQGVYVLMEKIKKNENRVNIAKLKPEDIEGDELTGGYIVRVDKVDWDFQYGIDGWYSIPNPPFPNAKHILFQFYYPKPDEIVAEQKVYIQDYILETENALTKSTFTNRETGYNRYLNTGSFVDHLLINEVSKEVDKYRYSTYFFKEKDSDGGKLFSGPAWDFNLGYANVDYWAPGIDYTGWVYTDVQPYEASIMFWWKRLMQDEYFQNLAKTRWDQLRQSKLSNARLEFVIDSITGFIDQAQERNYQRWPILGQYVWPNYNWQNNTYDDEVEFFKNWLFERVAWIDDNLSGTPLYPSAELSSSAYVLEVNLIDDYFSRTILKNKYFSLNNAPSGIEIDSVHYWSASSAKIYLSEAPKNDIEISLTIDAKVINTWDNLTTNAVWLPVGERELHDNISLHVFHNTIYLSCNNPLLLGKNLDFFNINGQRVSTVHIQSSAMNSFSLQLKNGIYICRFFYDEKWQTQRILLCD